MIAAGFFPDERIELIRGVIVEMRPQNAPHAALIQLLTRLLLPPLVGRAEVRVQLPFAAGDDSLPEPNLAVVPPGCYADAHPDNAFLLDRGRGRFAVVLPPGEGSSLCPRGCPGILGRQPAGRIVERHSEPAAGAYARTATFRPGQTLTPLAFADVTIAVDDLFGP